MTLNKITYKVKVEETKNKTDLLLAFMMDKETYLSFNIPRTFNLDVDEMFPLLEYTINVSDDDITSYLKLYEMKSLKNKK